MKNIFTVDLEDWYHGNFIDKSDRPGLFRSERLVKQTNKILYLLEKTKNKATFFVLGADAITGTRKGIGRSLIEYYANKGFLVIGCSRRNVDFESDNYRHFSLDVCNEKNVNKMFSEIRKVYGRLDILINNAGIASMNLVLLTPLKKTQDILNTNVLGTFLFCREAGKIMKINGFGRIVNFSSIATKLRIEGEAIYAASKSAVVNFTEILSKEYAEFGITVNAIAPTPVKTDLIRAVPKEKIDNIIQGLAIKRSGEFRDISNVLDFSLVKRVILLPARLFI